MSAENPADVIEQAAKVIRPLVDTIYGCAIDGGYQPPKDEASWPFADRLVSRLADAGLLADPADQDEPDWQAIADQAEQDMAHWVRECGDAERRAERAEAELSNMEADYERRGERLWRLAAKAGHEPSESDNDASAELTIETALTELRATVERVREFLSEPVAVLSDGAVRDNYRMARAALDGGGQQ